LNIDSDLQQSNTPIKNAGTPCDAAFALPPTAGKGLARFADPFVVSLIQPSAASLNHPKRF
jgi:hypothetical protein